MSRVKDPGVGMPGRFIRGGYLRFANNAGSACCKCQVGQNIEKGHTLLRGVVSHMEGLIDVSSPASQSLAFS